MSFDIDVGIKFTIGSENYCFFHAVQLAMDDVRVKAKIYDGSDEYDTPGVCPHCLEENPDSPCIRQRLIPYEGPC